MLSITITHLKRYKMGLNDPWPLLDLKKNKASASAQLSE